MATHHEIVIAGGGTAGLSVAAQLLNQDPGLDVAIIEPSAKHYYQPIWTLVGAGVFPREISERSEADYIPFGATWIQDAVASFDPESNAVTTASGESITYDYLVVALGIQLDWDQIDGLKGNVGKHGICSNYSYETVNSTAENIASFTGGKAIFTMPSGPIKCAGAPQKIMWLAEEAFRKQGVRRQSEVICAFAGPRIFGVLKYRLALEKLIEDRGITTRFEHELVSLKPTEKTATFKKVGSGDLVDMKYDMIHVTPPQSAPDIIKESTLSNDAGWVEVDKFTTQHTRYPNVFSLGDCSSLPTSKTGAAVRKEAPVTVANLLSYRKKEPLTAKYNGYASCPLVTGVGEVILAEFDYDGNPAESFPFDQARPRYSMYALKAYGLPQMYWNGMLKGRM